MSGTVRAFPGRGARRREKGRSGDGGERSLGLVLVASLQGLFAVLLALFAAMNAAALVLGEGERGARAALLVLEAPGAVSVAALAAGALFLRRWAASLSLAFAWVALFAGANAVALEIAAAPRLLVRLEGASAVVHPLLTLAVLLATQTLLFVLLPLGFALFYRRPAVAAAFRRGDAKSRWTDRQPAPILVLAAALAGLAALGLALTVAVAVAAGATVHWVGLGSGTALAVLAGLAAHGVLRRRRWAWLASVGLAVAALGTSLTLAARPLIAADLATVWARGQGAAVRFYLGRLFAPGYQAWVALQAAALTLAVWRLRGHFRRALEIVGRAPGRGR